MMEPEIQDVNAGIKGAAEGCPPAAGGDLQETNARLRADLKEKTVEVEVLNDRLLRLHAEFENYKKRMARERSELVKFANEALILEFLPVLDNLERAVATARSGTDSQGVTEGLEIILRLFQAVLEKAGVKAIESVEREFDPNHHQAVAQVESPDGRDGIVVEDIRKGYLFEGRLLRPSMVKVSKVSGPRSEVRGPSCEEEEPGTRNPAPGTSDA